MAIQKKEYELSIWNESLNINGQKEESKGAVIGAHDMTHPGRATANNLVTKINGTHTLTFQLPDKYFDSEKGEFVHNDLSDALINERKIKLKRDNEWFEFYIKDIRKVKNYKSNMFEYSCSDSFIDELSRNGYNIIFNTELFNNVEELGVFNETILDGSSWKYDAQYNTGDFTEFSEEKLFKIPVGQFSSINGYKLSFEINNSETQITNIFTNEKRNLEMSDDKAREEKYFWDNGSFDNGFSLIDDNNLIKNIENDGYIYVPYSQLDFCYCTTDDDSATVATEEAYTFSNGTYALAPSSIDPTHLIQFIAIPANAKVNIDDGGIITNKNYSYVMTVEMWNQLCKNALVYKFEKYRNNDKTSKKEVVEFKSDEDLVYGNKICSYDGYLQEINDVEVFGGKKISISDRTELNVTEEINQYVTVYQNKSEEFKEMFTNEKWKDNSPNYRVCSKIATRQIVPQLARNLIQNGENITSTDGWEIMKLSDDLDEQSAQIKVEVTNDTDNADNVHQSSYLNFTKAKLGKDTIETDDYNTIINFGLIGQEVTIEKNKIYCFGIELDKYDYNYIEIGQGNVDNEGGYSLLDNKDNKIKIKLTDNFKEQVILFKPTKEITNPYVSLYLNNDTKIKKMFLFEAYTKGRDFFDNAAFKYSGRELFSGLLDNTPTSIRKGYQTYSYKLVDAAAIKNMILFETDIMEGDTYQYNQYFIQQLNIENSSADTFMHKEFLSEEGYTNSDDVLQLPLYSGKYTEDDYEIVTNYLDLNLCEHYKPNNIKGQDFIEDNFDCHFGQSEDEPNNKVCMYQKYGYCPYLFKTQKHCRKIRTLDGQKSNRFNLTQELSKVFEVYPIYYIAHNDNGSIKTDENNNPIKKVFYITEKGSTNDFGFRYEKNLSNIEKNIISDNIVTKLYVEDVDSSLSKTGMCSIKTAEDNPSKDSFIIDFSYYIKQGLLDKTKTENDLYGTSKEDLGFLKTLGYYNGEYDKLTNKIINLQNESYSELEANLTVNLEGIQAAQKELGKIKKQMDRYKSVNVSEEEQNDTYQNYKIKFLEQQNILRSLIEATFYTDGYCINSEGEQVKDILSLNFFNKTDFNTFKEEWIDTHKYKQCGILGQYNSEYSQIQKWKKERSRYLKDINSISEKFYNLYEPFLKEGIWSDSNYLTDNAYYFDAKQVAAEGAIPQVNYTISVVDISSKPEYEDYTFNIADTTYVEDTGMFGINEKTSLPNKLKVIISGITENLDIPTNNSIEVQNYTTAFEDLFQQVTSSIQSLTFNENIYKRASNFTATQNISNESLQGALDTNELTLISTKEKNINIDATGQSGSDINNHSNKYKLTGEGLFFSNNGGETWNTGVGPSGINADYIKTGTLDAQKIRIMSGDYLYFLWDQSGITAYRGAINTQGESQGENNNNQSNKNPFGDYAKFNKYGLSMVENGKIKLRAGYEFSGTNGEVSTENKIGENIGFYLYNQKGDVIFKTEEGENNSARLSLGGEMYASDSLEGSLKTTYIYSDYQFTLQGTMAYNSEEADLNIYENYKNNNVSLKDAIESYVSGSSSINRKIFTNTEDSNLSYTVYTEASQNNYVVIFNSTNKTTKLIKTIVKVLTLVYKNEEEPEDENRISLYLFPYSNKTYTITNNVAVTTYLEKDSSINKRDFNYALQKAPFNYYNASGNFVETEEEYYYYTSSNNKILLFKTEEKQEDKTEVSNKDKIEIYINNQSINDTDIKLEPEYNTRLLSCVQKDNKDNLYKNIFSILSDGGLYIGGTIKEQKKATNEGYLSNYIKIEQEETDDTIVLKNGLIYVGEKSLISAMEDKIDELAQQIAGLGLINHSHSLELEVEKDTVSLTDVKEQDYFTGKQFILQFNSDDDTDNGGCPLKVIKYDDEIENSYFKTNPLVKDILKNPYIGITNLPGGAFDKDKNCKTTISWVSLSDFLNILKLTVKGKTDASGSIEGINSTSTDRAATESGEYYVVEGF